MKKPFTTILCIVVMAAVCALSSTAWGGRLEVRITGDRMDADLERAPMRMVLAGITRQTGIQVLLEKGLGGEVTARFSNLSLEEGLKRILSDYSNSMIFSRPEEGPDKGQIVLSEIRVFKKSHASASQFEALDPAEAEVQEGPGGATPPLLGAASVSPGAAPAGTGVGSGSTGNVSGGLRQGEGGVVAALRKRHAPEIRRLRRDIALLRQDLGEMTDRRLEAKTRAIISRKTAELKKRETWMNARTYGFARLERQMAAR